MKNRSTACLIFCILCSLLTFLPLQDTVRVYAGKKPSLVCAEGDYDPAAKTLTVHLSLPEGMEAKLIAVSQFLDGSLKETRVSQASASGDYRFTFGKASASFRVFAVDPGNLAPVADDRPMQREFTDQDIDVETKETDLSLNSEKTATALGGMASDYLASEKALGEVGKLLTETVVVSGNTVTRFEAVYDNKEALEEALTTVSAAEAKYGDLRIKASVLDDYAEDEEDERLRALALQAGTDAMAGENALKEIRIYLENKYSISELDDSGIRDIMTRLERDRRIHIGGGNAALTASGLLLTGADLCVVTGDEKSFLILEPESGKLENAPEITSELQGAIYAYAKNGDEKSLAYLKGVSQNGTPAFDHFALEASGSGLQAQVTTLTREEITREKLISLAGDYFGLNSLGEEHTFSQASESFISANALTEEDLDVLEGGGLPYVVGYFNNLVYTSYNESRGYRVVDEYNYSQTRRTRYTLDQDRNYVGYYEMWENDRKTMESYYSEDRKNGYNGLIYQKYWDSSTGLLGSETRYSSSPLISVGLTAPGPEGASGQSAPGQEEAQGLPAVGEKPRIDGPLFRTERDYWIRDDFGNTYNGQLKSEHVYQWRQDFYDRVIREKGEDFEWEAENTAWFQLLYRFYYPDPAGQMSSEQMAMQSGTAMRNRDFTEKGELRQEKWHPFNEENMNFEFAHYAVYTWYVSYMLESPAMSRLPAEMKSEILGHPEVIFNSQRGEGESETYIPGMWMVQRENDENHAPIPGTINTVQGTPQFWEYDAKGFNGEFYDPNSFDCIGWKHINFDDVEYIPVITHYQVVT